jgi:hypothetical protein
VRGGQAQSMTGRGRSNAAATGLGQVEGLRARRWFADKSCGAHNVETIERVTARSHTGCARPSGCWNIASSGFRCS